MSACPHVRRGVRAAEAIGVEVEALFISVLGLQPPWDIENVELDTARGRIDFQICLRRA